MASLHSVLSSAASKVPVPGSTSIRQVNVWSSPIALEPSGVIVIWASTQHLIALSPAGLSREPSGQSSGAESPVVAVQRSSKRTPRTVMSTQACTSSRPASGELSVIVHSPLTVWQDAALSVPGPPFTMASLHSVPSVAASNEPVPVSTSTRHVNSCDEPGGTTGLVPSGVTVIRASTTENGSQMPSDGR